MFMKVVFQLSMQETIFYKQSNEGGSPEFLNE